MRRATRAAATRRPAGRPAPHVIVEDLAGLIEAIRHSCRQRRESTVWCRGHGRAAWKLVPSIHRRAVGREGDLAARFQLRAPALHPRCPGPEDFAAWLPLMRHYGLATRLLDWTDSPIVAAFFAVSYERHEGPRAIWLLHPLAMNRRSGLDLIPYLQHERVQPLLAQAFGREHPQCGPLAVSAPEMDLRMALQGSHYTIHTSPQPLEDHPASGTFLQKLVLPEAAVARLRDELSTLGIRRSLIFPDLEHLAQEIEDEASDAMANPTAPRGRRA